MSFDGGPQDPYATPQGSNGDGSAPAPTPYGVPATSAPTPYGVPAPPAPTPYGVPAPPAPTPYGTTAPGGAAYGAMPPMPPMPPTGYGPMVGVEKNNLGVWALVLGIVSIVSSPLGLFPGIAAVIVGKKSKQAQTYGQANNGTLGQVGLVLGWVGIAFAILVIVGLIVLLASRGTNVLESTPGAV